MVRLFNVREGFGRKDDRLPSKFQEVLTPLYFIDNPSVYVVPYSRKT
ncbi:aldehyde ferredoxin oxidoreductase C-terminal domain-containing protein [Candidatus Hakubella thermalkaliphila]